MASVDAATMWSKWYGQLASVALPNGTNGSGSTFSAASLARNIDFGDANAAVINEEVWTIGDSVPVDSPTYGVAPSGLVTSYGLFLDWIDLKGDPNPNLDSQINIANAAFNAAQLSFTSVQSAAFTAYASYKVNATGAGLAVPPFPTWLPSNYPALSAAQSQLAGAQSKMQQLGVQRYGPGYQTVANARSLAGFTYGGAQDVTDSNPNNMSVAFATYVPAGSVKVLVGDPPPTDPSLQLTSFAPRYALDPSFAQALAQWQTNSANNTSPTSITVSSSSVDYDYANAGWSYASHASYGGWFWSRSASSSGQGQTMLPAAWKRRYSAAWLTG